MSRPPRVVVASESVESRELVSRLLVGEAIEVVVATEGEAVLDLVRTQGADLVLVDSRLAGDEPDGLDVCRRLRRDGQSRLLPVVVISQFDSIDNRVAALDAGADDFLSRPIERNELVARVRSLLRLKSMHDRLEDARQLIFALANAAEAKDLFTLEHTERVADTASEVARRVRLDIGVIEQIRVGALIHDIGKLAVPDRVLDKPGPLTDEEFDLVKTHTVVGAEIVSPLASQRHLVAIVRNHHERFDGAGYPDRLAGEAIPLAARIVAVCDAYDAMVNQRPYRAAMDPKVAVERLLAGRNSQWDGELVDAFVAINEHR